MQVIGIVGGIGAGKTTVVSIFQKIAKVAVINADEVGHSILLPKGEAYQEVVDTFGKEILDEKGQIDRRKLGKIVFSNKEKLKKLNAITHPKIVEKIKRQLNQYKKEKKYEYILIDAPLLIEVGLKPLVDKVIGVYAEENLRIERIQIRNQFTYEEAVRRIRAQRKWEELKKDIDHMIDNSFSYEYTKEQIEKMLIIWQGSLSS